MITINYIEGNRYFTLNGKKHPQIYQAVAMGTNHIAIYNIHDIKNQLLSTTSYTEVSVNGVFHNSQDELLTTLIPILFHGSSDGLTQVVQDNYTRVINIDVNELETPDKQGVVKYINSFNLTKNDIETVIIRVTGTIEEIPLVIKTPTEGQETGTDFTVTFEDDSEWVSISNLTDGQEISNGFTLKFKAI